MIDLFTSIPGLTLNAQAKINGLINNINSELYERDNSITRLQNDNYDLRNLVDILNAEVQRLSASHRNLEQKYSYHTHSIREVNRYGTSRTEGPY